MRNVLKIAALATAVTAAPAFAQVNVGLGGQVGVGVNAGGAVNDVTNGVGRFSTAPSTVWTGRRTDR